jgi:hypothetical protein
MSTDTIKAPAEIPYQPDGIKDFVISDFESFEGATTGTRDLAALYFYSMTDCLVELARAAAADFFLRPQLYLDLRDDQLPFALARLQVRSGSDETVLSKEQREAIYSPVFGDAAQALPYGSRNPATAAEEMGFGKQSQNLIQAATAFAERAVDTGVDMLRRRVRATHLPFKQYLIGIQGASVHWSRAVALARLTEDTAYRILRNGGVAGVFGMTAPAPGWPYGEDANGDKLVAEMSKQLGSAAADGRLTRERFSNLQRAALRGAEAIATVIDVDLLIGKLYSWGSALRDVTAA